MTVSVNRMPHLQFCKLDKYATLPKKANISEFHQDAAFDLFPSLTTSLVPGERALIPTGLAAIIPSGYWIKFHERSGLSSKSGIHILGGVIDNTYLGEWKVVMYNSGSSAIEITPDKAIAQFTLEMLNECIVTEVDQEYFNTEFARRSDARKTSGFGSTDKN